MESALYIVATPIGNMGDITLRAIDVLRSVECIAAEDTRHTRRLLDALDIRTSMQSLHEHNEFERSGALLDRVEQGASIALVSDAGTPLISDPGYILVQQAKERGIKVVPVPGACAVIAALSASGADCRRFVFEGFLPAKSKARQECLAKFEHEVRTVVFYESPHRILETLEQMKALFPGRYLVLARELTKTFETIVRDTVENILDFVSSDSNQLKGEFVLVLEGEMQKNESEDLQMAHKLMSLLIDELPPKKAASVVAEATGVNKRALYDFSLQLKNKK